MHCAAYYRWWLNFYAKAVCWRTVGSMMMRWVSYRWRSPFLLDSVTKTLSRLVIPCEVKGRIESLLPCLQLLEAYENEYFFQMVMEKHGEGLDLFEFIERGPKLTEQHISFIFRQVCVHSCKSCAYMCMCTHMCIGIVCDSLRDMSFRCINFNLCCP